MQNEQTLNINNNIINNNNNNSFFKTFLSELNYFLTGNELEAVRRASLISLNNSLLNNINSKQQQQQQQQQSKKSASSSVSCTNRSRRVHAGIVCASCASNQIEGDRYSCTVCANYDLCSKCFCAGLYNKTHTPSHPCLCIPRPIKKEDFVKFEIESRLGTLADMYKSNENKNTVCSQCGKSIRGIHIKCDSCYNFSLCFECWKSEMHDKFHPMLIFFAEILTEIPFNRISLLEKLGNGAFGDVYKAFIRPDKSHIVAIKMSSSLSDGADVDQQAAPGGRMSLKESIESISNELNAHREIRSAYLCKLFGYSIANERVCLVLELMENGSLYDVIRKETQGLNELPLLRKLKILGDIACGLYDIHKKNFIHADLKPDNVLIDYNYNAKISDLGIIKNRNRASSKSHMNELGSVTHLPNEFFMNTYNKRVDVFSFGLVMYHFLSLAAHRWTKPQPGLDRKLILDAMHRVPVGFLKDLVNLAVQENQALRRDIFYYKWFLRKYTKSAEKLFQMSQIDEEYAKSSTNEKNRILMQANDSLLKTVNGESNLENEFLNIGISYNDLKRTREEAHNNNINNNNNNHLNNNIINNVVNDESLMMQIRSQNKVTASYLLSDRKTKICSIQ